MPLFKHDLEKYKKGGYTFCKHQHLLEGERRARGDVLLVLRKDGEVIKYKRVKKTDFSWPGGISTRHEGYGT